MFDRLRAAAAALVLTLVLLAGGNAFALDGIPPSHRLDFDVVRQGSVIGHHRFRFTEEAGKLVVDIDVNVKVDVMFVTVYRFLYQAREVWEGDRLVAMTVHANDDGTPHEVEAVLRDGAFAVTHNGTASRVPAGLLPTSLWNPATLKQTVLLGGLRGDVMPTTVTALDKSAVDTPAGRVTVEGYLVDAQPDFKRRVWYSDAGTLLAIGLKGQDGSDVMYRLR
jgi:Family of unknown function (DUF6134)